MNKTKESWVIVCGSHREESQSRKVANYLQKEVHNQFSGGVEANIIDLAGNPLPLWSPGEPSETWKDYESHLEKASAAILITPEWAGMATPGIKNFLLHASSTPCLAHKPVTIVGVSGSFGGAFPIAELRGSGYKNSKICFVPEHLIIRDAPKILEGDSAQNETDTYMRKRITYALNVLKEYSSALANVRTTKNFDLNEFDFGMS